MTELFVTGTDTGVGKTVVSATLASYAVSRAHTVACFKPAESGCRRLSDGSLEPADAVLLRERAGGRQRLDEVCPFRYEDAVAPGVAAARHGPRFDLARVAELVTAARARRPDLLLVEGAGGLLVPFGDGLLTADLARRLELPLLVVARPTLGTINHTLLTLECARGRGLRVEGVVLCDATGEAEQELAASNAEEIARLGEVPVLGLLPHLPALDASALADAAARHLKLAAL